MQEVRSEEEQRVWPGRVHTFFQSANAIPRGDTWMQHYQDLNALLSSDPEAKRYYDTLPDYAREQIGTRSDSVNSFASLKDYAQNVLRGDD